MEETMLYSATKPTGKLTLGNYIGAIKNWKEMQNNYNCIFAIADLHTLTVDISPEELRQNSLRQIATFLAFGIDPEQSIVYAQSSVHEHAELGWILTCNTRFGEASRMTQFKDQKAKNPNGISAGLFAYPMLMAADILLFDASLVPVGKDQKQHVELARDIAQRFNAKYGHTFEVPEPFTPKTGEKITDLLNPTKKMSKSDENENGVIYITDSDEAIRSKFKRAVTDSLASIRYNPIEQPGVSNLLTIYSVLSGQSVKKTEAHFAGKGYGALKTETAELVVRVLAPVRNKINELMANEPYLLSILEKGKQKASALAQLKLKDVYRKVGLLNINKQ